MSERLITKQEWEEEYIKEAVKVILKSIRKERYTQTLDVKISEYLLSLKDKIRIACLDSMRD